MLLAFLAKGDTFEQLGCHFGIGTETARRYVNEGIDALAAPASSLADALAASGEERRLLLDGALMSAWRCTSLATEATRIRSTPRARAATAGRSWPTPPLHACEPPQSGPSPSSRAGACCTRSTSAPYWSSLATRCRGSLIAVSRGERIEPTQPNGQASDAPAVPIEVVRGRRKPTPPVTLSQRNSSGDISLNEGENLD
ncbi:hypothetical protein DDE74_03940 [Streptomyces lydicus]|uniref:Transposase Helix-turn-helix domain-containing protein n=1 Tax=Streptomyces lydicus TaxID=47763 RepID=A0A3S9Y664_9ACTN|nr:hypothetical protein DDE74_03940 [Streptomyces lydicus]